MKPDSLQTPAPAPPWHSHRPGMRWLRGRRCVLYRSGRGSGVLSCRAAESLARVVPLPPDLGVHIADADDAGSFMLTQVGIPSIIGR